MKVANVCPIHKSGDELDPANYRPISLLTTLSKVLEKVVNIRLLGYLEKNSLLSGNQYGFRAARSTEDAVTSATDYITQKLDSGKACIGVFLDLAKAFDTVSRKILLEKMLSLGIRGGPLEWFGSYLSDRKQRVVVGSYCSDISTVHFGVPQGSVLGPTLFIIYINALCSLRMPAAKVFTYADDTAIVFHGDSWSDTQERAEAGLEIIANWLMQNLLTLNVEKTKFICFSTSKRASPKVPVSIKLHSCLDHTSCDCAEIKNTTCIKYLGVYLDSHLTWSKHVEALRTRVRKLIHIFKRLAKIATSTITKSIYYALCQSILGYCIVSWGAAAKTYLLKVERAQRALLKYAFGLPYKYSTDILYEETQVLRVRQLYILSVTLRFHKSSCTNIISSRSRRLLKWDTVKCHKSIGQKSFLFMGPYIYRKLDAQLKIATLLKKSCKRIVSSWLLGLDYMRTEAILSIPK